MANAKDKSDRIKDLLGEIRKYIKARKYRITNHAQERQDQHKLTLPNLLFILSTGFHEEKNTIFSNEFQTWKYAIRGKTIDNSGEFRIIVAFEDEMAVLTVIPLKEGK